MSSLEPRFSVQDFVSKAARQDPEQATCWLEGQGRQDTMQCLRPVRNLLAFNSWKVNSTNLLLLLSFIISYIFLFTVITNLLLFFGVCFILSVLCLQTYIPFCKKKLGVYNWFPKLECLVAITSLLFSIQVITISTCTHTTSVTYPTTFQNVYEDCALTSFNVSLLFH